MKLIILTALIIFNILIGLWCHSEGHHIPAFFGFSIAGMCIGFLISTALITTNKEN